MRKFFLTLFIVATSSIFCFFIYSYRFAGLREYFDVLASFNKMSQTNREEAKTNFYGSDEDDRYYNGILAGMTKLGNPVIWTWGKGGLKYFVADENSVFTFYSTCSAETLQKIEKGESFEIERDVYFDVNEWNKKVKPGMFVGMTIASGDVGDVKGNVRDVQVYDWWIFMRGSIKEQCARYY